MFSLAIFITVGKLLASCTGFKGSLVWESVSFFSFIFLNLSLSNIYTADRMHWFSGFEYFVKSGFEREPLILDKQMIPHFKGLDVGFKISQEQPCSFIRDDHATFLVKNTLFKEEVAWQPLRKLQSCSPSILEPSTRAFKWSIVCLSTIIGCGEIKGNVKKCLFYVVKISTFWHYP